MMKQLRNHKGMSIVEVLVAAGLTAVVSLGVATMIQNTMIEQKKIVLLSTLKEMKTRIEFLARDQGAWNSTVNVGGAATGLNNIALFNSLKANGTVAKVDMATPVKVVLYDAAGGVAMNLLGPDDAGAGPYNGFTEGGAACTAFSFTAPTDACPISYRLMVAATCPNATATCKNPQLKLVGRLVFKPGPNGVLKRFETMIPLVGGGTGKDITGDDANSTNGVGKYDAMVKRTGSQTNQTFKLSANFTSTSSTANCASNGVGACSTTFGIHPRTATWTEDADTGNLVTTAGSAIVFGETGQYTCQVAAPAWATGGFSLQLWDNTASSEVGLATVVAAPYSMGTAQMSTTFNVGDITHQYVVRQKCDAAPPAGADANCALGMATANTYNTTFAVVSLTCTKVDKSTM